MSNLKSKRKLVSVVITTKNSENTLENLLKSIKNQSYRENEIIVVDNASIDQTKKLAKKYTSMVFNKGPERSAQRNFGVSKAKGEYILILDSDMILGKNVIKQCIDAVRKNKDFEALIIPEQSFGEGFWANCKSFEREFYLGDETIESPRFFTKKVFERFNGYDLSITGPEDWDLPLRMRKAGVKIERVKGFNSQESNSFILHNEGRFSPWKSARKKFYYASGAKGFLARHPESIINKGNLLFRPIFFKKWRKLISSPVLTLGMLFIRTMEMTGAVFGITWAIINSKNTSK